MSLQKSVDDLVAKHGYAVSFSRAQSGGAYDPVTGDVTGGTTLTWSGEGIYADYMENEVNGTSITNDDRKLMLKATGLTRAPEPGDLVDDAYQILNVRTTKSGSTIIGYVCQVRG
jgi:hypothetical protein